VWDRSLLSRVKELGIKVELPPEPVPVKSPEAMQEPDEILNLARHIERMAQALQKTEASYRGIVEDQVDLICRYQPDGKLTFVNGAYARFFAKKRQEFNGLAFAPYEIGLRGQLGNEPVPLTTSFEFPLTDPAGKKFWYHWTNRAITTPEGAVIEYQAVGHDITLRKEAEVALRTAKEAAEQADRAKTEFLAIVSHEVRTPINGVNGFAKLLSETNLSAEQREFVDLICTSGRTLEVLIDDLLDLTKIEAGKAELRATPFAPKKFLDDLCAFFAPKASQSGLALDCRLDPSMPAIVTGDAERLRQILSNLIGNAVKFTEQGGITVDASAVKGDSVPSEPGRKYVTLVFTVRDTGIGIPAEKIDKLFKPFSQVDSSTKRKYGGTGLGLSISKKLCELMGGGITVHSEPGRGSTFTFTVRFEYEKGDSRAPLMPQAAV